MNARIPHGTPPASRTMTTVFQSGNSQAVRLPKEFRFNTKQVSIERRGDEIVLREEPLSLADALSQAFAGLPPLTAREAEALHQAMAQTREQRPPEERDFSWMDAAPPGRAPGKRRAGRKA